MRVAHAFAAVSSTLIVGCASATPAAPAASLDERPSAATSASARPATAPDERPTAATSASVRPAPTLAPPAPSASIAAPRPTPPCSAEVPCDEGYRVPLVARSWEPGHYVFYLETEGGRSTFNLHVTKGRCPRAGGLNDPGPRLVVSCREGGSEISGVVVVPTMKSDRPPTLVVRVTRDGAPLGGGTVTLPWVESRECVPTCVWAHTSLQL